MVHPHLPEENHETTVAEDVAEAQHYLKRQKERYSGEKREKHKDDEMRADDVAYTLNHAIVCTATDWLEPPINSHVAPMLRNAMGHPPRAAEHESYWHHLKEWSAGELLGDFGAVPITIGLQRYAPGFMAGLGKHVLEPVVGGVFRNSAERAAKAWAEEKGVDPDSEDYKTRKEYLYRYEVDHLPQAAVWTLASTGLNVLAQKHMLKHASFGHIPNSTDSYATLLGTKSVGAGITAGLVFSGRTMAPNKVKKFDGWLSDKVVAPTTSFLGLESKEEAPCRKVQTSEHMHHDRACPKNGREELKDYRADNSIAFAR